jgi:hypothetical protein
VNLELPFDDLPHPELDEYLARIDQELDTLFLDAVAGELERLRADAPRPDPAAAVA